jgi:hypothetical protein
MRSVFTVIREAAAAGLDLLFALQQQRTADTSRNHSKAIVGPTAFAGKTPQLAMDAYLKKTIIK